MTRTRDISHDSDEVVLEFVGGDRTANGIPDRDLTGNDVARQAFLREYAEVAADGKTPDPRDPKPETVRAVIDDLVASGLYANPGGRKRREPEPLPDGAEPTTEGG